MVRVHELRYVIDQALGRYGLGNNFLRHRDGVCARWCRRVGHGGAAVSQEVRVHEPEEPQSHLLFKVSDYTDAQAALNIA